MEWWFRHLVCIYCICVYEFIPYLFRESEREIQRFQAMLWCYFGKVSFANAEPTALTKSRSPISCLPVQSNHPLDVQSFKIFDFNVSLQRSVSSDAVQLASWSGLRGFPLNLRQSKPVLGQICRQVFVNLEEHWWRVSYHRNKKRSSSNILRCKLRKSILASKNWEMFYYDVQDGDLTTFPRKTRPSVSSFSVLSCPLHMLGHSIGNSSPRFAALSAQVHARAWRFDRLGFAHKSAGKIWYGNTSGLKILCIQGRCFEHVEWYLLQFFLIDVLFLPCKHQNVLDLFSFDSFYVDCINGRLQLVLLVCRERVVRQSIALWLLLVRSGRSFFRNETDCDHEMAQVAAQKLDLSQCDFLFEFSLRKFDAYTSATETCWKQAGTQRRAIGGTMAKVLGFRFSRRGVETDVDWWCLMWIGLDECGVFDFRRHLKDTCHSLTLTQVFSQKCL